MNNTFFVPNSISKFEGVVKKLKDDLIELTTSTVPEEEVKAYVEKALDQYIVNSHNPKMFFWQLISPDSVPSEERVEYVYKPTYYMTAILMYAVLHYESVRSIDGILNVVCGAMTACTGRRFKGHGYYSHDGVIDTLAIMKQGQAFDFMEKYPELNKEFYCLLNEACNDNKQLTIENVWKKANQSKVSTALGRMTKSEYN